jgi:DNA-binding NtrC family response regulator
MLLLDDDPQQLGLLEGICAFLGHEPIACQNPLEAINGVQRQAAQAVLTDYHMPGVDGVSLLAEIRAIDPGVRRVVITCGHLDERLQRGLDDGTIDLLLFKPLRIDTVRRLVGLLESGASGLVVNEEPGPGRSSRVACLPCLNSFGLLPATS